MDIIKWQWGHQSIEMMSYVYYIGYPMTKTCDINPVSMIMHIIVYSSVLICAVLCYIFHIATENIQQPKLSHFSFEQRTPFSFLNSLL